MYRSNLDSLGPTQFKIRFSIEKTAGYEVDLNFLKASPIQPLSQLRYDLTSLLRTEIVLTEAERKKTQRISSERVMLESLYLEEALRRGHTTGLSLRQAIHKSTQALESFFSSRIEAHARYDLQPAGNRNEAAHARLLIKELTQVKDLVLRIHDLTASSALTTDVGASNQTTPSLPVTLPDQVLLGQLSSFIDHLLNNYVLKLRVHLEQLLAHPSFQQDGIAALDAIDQLEREIKMPLTGQRQELKRALQHLPRISIVDESLDVKWWRPLVRKRTDAPIRLARILAEKDDGTWLILGQIKSFLSSQTFGFSIFQNVMWAPHISGGLDHVLTVDILKILRTVQCERSEVQVSVGMREVGLSERKEVARLIWNGQCLLGFRQQETVGETRQQNQGIVIT